MWLRVAWGCFWGAELWGHSTGAEPRRKPHEGARGAETWEHGEGCLGFFTMRERGRPSCTKEKFGSRKQSPPLTTVGSGHGISENPVLGGPFQESQPLGGEGCAEAGAQQAHGQGEPSGKSQASRGGGRRAGGSALFAPPREDFWGGATDGVTGMFAGGTRACGCRERAFLPCGNSRCRGIFIQE